VEREAELIGERGKGEGAVMLTRSSSRPSQKIVDSSRGTEAAAHERCCTIAVVVPSSSLQLL
jgi:hypothetical protein